MIIELEEIRRQQILSAAVKAIAASGQNNVTMSDICDQANLSKGGVAHYYPSKQHLFTAAFEAFFERIFRQAQEIMARHHDPTDKILSFVWLVDSDNPDVAMGYPILLDFMSMAAHDAGYRQLHHRWVNAWLALLSGIVEQGQAQGRFLNTEPEAAARAISAVYQGFSLRWYLTPELYPEQWTVETLKQTLKVLLASFDNEHGSQGSDCQFCAQ